MQITPINVYNKFLANKLEIKTTVINEKSDNIPIARTNANTNLTALIPNI